MNITVDKQAKCKATLKVEIPADQVSGQRQSIVSKYAGQARVPGFRPGKAPQDVIEKRYHKQITEELNENLFNLAIDEAIQKEELKVLNYGALKICLLPPMAVWPLPQSSSWLPMCLFPIIRVSR